VAKRRDALTKPPCRPRDRMRRVLLHHSYAYLDVGDIIRAGNWGRIVRGYGTWHPQFLRESLFESLRSRAYAHLPSRLTCSFAYEDEDSAQRGMLDGDVNVAPSLYAVEAVDAEALQHVADHELVTVPGGLFDTAALEERILTYWQGRRLSQFSEVLVASDLRVVDVRQRATWRHG
jgi:hypothetical protein